MAGTDRIVLIIGFSTHFPATFLVLYVLFHSTTEILLAGVHSVTFEPLMKVMNDVVNGM